MLKGIPLPAVLVDIETTGGPRYGRITEIAIIEIDEHEIREWSTLVNPEIDIPINIQHLTGITNAMVASAPRFEDVSEEVFLRLKDKLFIAHNVGFDYGFLRKELGNVGISFKAPLMCSVKISRVLYPNAASHSLENIIIRHSISVQYRHRALDDAQATFRFLQLAENEHGVEQFRAAFHKQFQYGDLPLGIDPDIINKIPRTPGIYYLWDKDNKLLYIGKGNNIRAEVFAQFLSGEKSPLEAKLANLTGSITWTITSGELSATLLHTEKINQLKPALNKRTQTVESLCSVFLEETKPASLKTESDLFANNTFSTDNNIKAWLYPRIVFADEIAESNQRLYGLFTAEKQALKEIKKIFITYNLCFNNLPQRTSNGLLKCENNQCKVCNAGENYLKHNIRMLAAFEQLALRRWPFKTPISIEESGKDCEPVHILVSNWCLLGVAKNMEDYEELLSFTNGFYQERFHKEGFRLDRNVYRFLVKYLNNPHHSSTVNIIPSSYHSPIA
ncbi:MAG: exonuclease domain-containing protein [Pseudomonadota bacterium]